MNGQVTGVCRLLAIFIAISLLFGVLATGHSLAADAACALKNDQAPEDTIAQCGSVIENPNTSPGELSKAYFIRGSAYRERSYGDKKSYALALADFDEALRLKPDFIAALYGRGLTFYILGLHKKAIADFDAGLRLVPGDPIISFMRGTTNEALERYEAAISDFDVVIRARLPVNYTLAITKRGTLHRKLGQIDLAMNDFNEALRADPKFGYAYCERGQTFEDADKNSLALADYDAAIRFNPSICLRNRSSLRSKMGDKAGAKVDQDRITAIESGNHSASKR